MTKKGRSSELLLIRNHALITRYWYWTVIWQRNHEKVLETLEVEEFFIRSATIDVIIRNDDEIYSQLMQERPTASQLHERYPAFHFEDNPHAWGRK